VNRAVVTLVGLVLAAAVATTARADGDPASDVLVYRNVYLPYAAPSKAAGDALDGVVARSYAQGDRVKVAVIQAKVDLGAIPSLFDKPMPYAHFLGTELSTLFVGPLLIVMPAGYGIYDGGRTTQAEEQVLGTLPRPASNRPNDLVAAATNAVSKLLGAGALRSSDILEPYAGLISVRRDGRRLVIRYFLTDDSGRVAAALTVRHGGSVLVTERVRLHATSFTRAESRTLALPAGIGLRVCVAATDPAGNRSAPSCKRI
jgi:hypothetical protein